MVRGGKTRGGGLKLKKEEVQSGYKGKKPPKHREDNHPLEVFKTRPDKALTTGLSLCPTLLWAASRMRDLPPQVSSRLSDSVTPYLLRACFQVLCLYEYSIRATDIFTFV